MSTPGRNGGRNSRALILRAFKLRGCEDCDAKPIATGGELEWHQFHCDHRDPATKTRVAITGLHVGGGDVSSAVGTNAGLVEELAKCDCVCEECHKRRHRDRRSMESPQQTFFTSYEFSEWTNCDQLPLIGDSPRLEGRHE